MQRHVFIVDAESKTSGRLCHWPKHRWIFVYVCIYTFIWMFLCCHFVYFLLVPEYIIYRYICICISSNKWEAQTLTWIGYQVPCRILTVIPFCSCFFSFLDISNACCCGWWLANVVLFSIRTIWFSSKKKQMRTLPYLLLLQQSCLKQIFVRLLLAFLLVCVQEVNIREANQINIQKIKNNFALHSVRHRMY